MLPVIAKTGLNSMKISFLAEIEGLKGILSGEVTETPVIKENGYSFSLIVTPCAKYSDGLMCQLKYYGKDKIRLSCGFKFYDVRKKQLFPKAKMEHKIYELYSFSQTTDLIFFYWDMLYGTKNTISQAEWPDTLTVSV